MLDVCAKSNNESQTISLDAWSGSALYSPASTISWSLRGCGFIAQCSLCRKEDTHQALSIITYHSPSCLSFGRRKVTWKRQPVHQGPSHRHRKRRTNTTVPKFKCFQLNKCQHVLLTAHNSIVRDNQHTAGTTGKTYFKIWTYFKTWK